MADDIISDSPEWHSSDAATQAAMADFDFNRLYGKDKTYLKSSTEEKAITRKAYNNVLANTAYYSTYNKVNQDAATKQEDSDNSGYLANLFTKILDSHKDLVNRLPITGDALRQDGAVSDGFAGNASKYYDKQKGRIYTAEDKAVAKTLLDVEKKIEKNGFWSWDGVKAMVEAAPELATNLGGVINVGADSISSMTSIAAGAAAGGAAGSALPVVGTAIGAGAGMFAAETGDAVSSKLLELAKTKLDAVGLPPTKQNFALLAQNKEWVQSAQKDALTYATTLAATDTVIGAGLGRVFSAPARAALNKARIIAASTDNVAIAAMAKASNTTIEKATENFININASAIMKANSFKSKLGMFAGNATAEALGEPVTEAVAKAAIGEDATFTDLANEFLGGVGSGPIAAVIDKAAFGTKIAADTTKTFVKNIVSATPESKAMAQMQKDALKAEQTLSKTQADAGYKQDIATVEHTDDVHAEMSDPTNPKYNAIKATEILTKYDTPDAYNKASAIEAHERQSYITNMTRLQELVGKQESGTALTKVEEEEVNGLTKLTPVQEARIKKLNGFVDTIYNNAQAKRNKERDAIEIDPTTATQPQVVESLSFGSSPHKNALTNDAINELIKKPDLDEDVKTLLADMKEAKTIRAAIEENATKPNTQGKTIADVSNDIYHGIKNSDFKGIDSYVQGITHFLNPLVNNTAKATAELTGLKKFRDAHVAKAAMVNAVYESVTKGTPLSAVHKAAYADAQAKAKLSGKTFEIRQGYSDKLVANINQEANALNSEVKLAESLYKTLSNKTNTSTSTQTQAAPTEAVADPAITKPATETVASSKPSNNTTPEIAKPVTPEPAKTGATRLNKLVKDAKAGNTSDDGYKEFRDIYQAAKKAGATDAQLNHIQEQGKIYSDIHRAPKTIVKPDPVTASTSDLKPEAIVAPSPVSETVTTDPTETVKATTEVIEDMPDNLAAYEADNIEIEVTNPDGTKSMVLYSDAITDIEAQLKEAEEILKCVQKG